MDSRIVFMGTPDFAVPSLVKLAEGFQVVGVITQPDRPSGRGRKLVPSPVKHAALEHGLEVFQPENANTENSLQKIREWDPDLICVAAYGQILKPPLLDLPQFGCINVHASLLPRWRGASPISAAILHDDSQTGVTIMQMGPGLDDGPILAQESIDILADETAGSLSDRLADLGGKLLAATIPLYVGGNISPRIQDHSFTTYAPQLKKSAGELNFDLSAESLARTVRAFSPWPGTFTFWKELRLIIHQARAVSVTSPGAGVLTVYDGYPAIGTSAGILVLDQLQLAGKNKTAGSAFINGNPDWKSK
ncbi:MAG TPA: methionyl-tRNA formyltransferase [Chloroflexi bacterium]|nr:methionyl-tRNA formyltransferase [Chloroflexota bacterium]